jgi:hypothetical protein
MNTPQRSHRHLWHGTAVACIVLLAAGAALAGPSDGRWRKRVPEGEKLLGTRPIGIEGRVLYRVSPITGAAGSSGPDGTPAAPGIRVRPSASLSGTSGAGGAGVGPSSSSGASLLPPIRVRIADVRQDGDVLEYDIRFIGEVEGLHDLRTSLERIDLGPRRQLPHAFVQVTAYFDEASFDAQLTQADRVSDLPKLGGYEKLMKTLGLAWAVPVVLAIVWWLVGFMNRQRAERKRLEAERAAAAAAPTIAEQLARLAEAILAGRDTVENKAALEATLLRYWRGELNLTGKPVIDALSLLRQDAKAGALLRAMDAWLHRDPATPHEKPDIAALLAPYRSPRPAAVAAGSREPELAAAGGGGAA